MMSYNDVPRPLPGQASFGAPTDGCEIPGAPEPEPRLFVTWVSNHLTGAVPRVQEFDDSPTGRSQVAALVRSEKVLAVVRGHRAEISTESVVKVTIGDRALVDQVPLMLHRGENV